MKLIPSFGRKKPKTKYINRSGAYGILIDGNGEVGIICIEKDFFLPGGGKKENESNFNCLRRELLEEVGCQIINSIYLGEAIDYIYSFKYKKYYCIPGYYYHITDYKIVQKPIDNNHIFLWINPDKAVRKLSREAQKWALKKVLK